jgi:FixJ family two-component response regulator
VVAGRTNKEVAATLFLSEKTVENNLSRVTPSSACGREPNSPQT